MDLKVAFYHVNQGNNLCYGKELTETLYPQCPLAATTENVVTYPGAAITPRHLHIFFVVVVTEFTTIGRKVHLIQLSSEICGNKIMYCNIFQISKPPSFGHRCDSNSQPSDLWANT